MKAAAIFTLRAQRAFSPIWRSLLGSSGPCCRFHPTCSEYAEEAIRSHGLIKGGGMALRRLLRCHPWGGAGFDPVRRSA
ncbi:MAG: membrane protein insertion efficiency factor YidD [Verrucomicrobia bacterium]|nr:membrane protein insertion efficiency factor YidD [bacterium]NDA10792.1 membrane protein insertion efficiency factor YidD [Verrucomicrobiota bacterium]NDD57412.1 membrane protein insertion efficiency factor YidD [Verrucomicrobiota bacterium]